MAEISDAISTSAQGPAKASGDGGSIEQHPLPDQIAADRYLAAKAAATKAHRGIRFTKLIPGGAD